MIDDRLPVPAHIMVLRCSHTFNVLDARGAVSTTERAKAFGRMRTPGPRGRRACGPSAAPSSSTRWAIAELPAAAPAPHRVPVPAAGPGS